APDSASGLRARCYVNADPYACPDPDGHSYPQAHADASASGHPNPNGCGCCASSHRGTHPHTYPQANSNTDHTASRHPYPNASRGPTARLQERGRLGNALDAGGARWRRSPPFRGL
ncbi:MAG: hypothetical protein Q8P22_03255, partial [Chloroflexota bacterium]|nr:hypothetical protein [Chloroflexota bacterium]